MSEITLAQNKVVTVDVQSDSTRLTGTWGTGWYMGNPSIKTEQCAETQVFNVSVQGWAGRTKQPVLGAADPQRRPKSHKAGVIKVSGVDAASMNWCREAALSMRVAQNVHEEDGAWDRHEVCPSGTRNHDI